MVDRPDLEGRRAILNVHAKGKPLAKGVDVEVLARRTPGFTGADLANLMNEAALLTARRGFKEIGMPQLEEAIDRVIAGPERKSRIISEKEKRVIAYHEGGHALVGHALPDADPIHKISIIARGRALGWTLALPTEDKYLTTRSALRDQLAMLHGRAHGRGADLPGPHHRRPERHRAGHPIARAMVTEYGMSDEIGPQQLGPEERRGLPGPGVSATRPTTPSRWRPRSTPRSAASSTRPTTRPGGPGQHRKTLDRLAEALMEKETLDTPEVMEILADVPKRPPRSPRRTLPGRNSASIEAGHRDLGAHRARRRLRAVT